MVFDAGGGLDATGDIHAEGLRLAHGAGDVFRGEAAAKEEGFVRETATGFGGEGPVAKATGAAEVIGGVGVEDEGVGGVVLEEGEALDSVEGEGADDGEAERFDGGAEAGGFVTVELDGFEESAVHSGTDVGDVGVNEEGHPRGAAGEMREPGPGCGKGMEALGFRVEIDTDGAGPGFGADGGVCGVGNAADFDKGSGGSGEHWRVQHAERGREARKAEGRERNEEERTESRGGER